MRIKFTLLLIFSVISFSSYGQLFQNSIAPDFTVTDVEGNEHHLYDLLDEGKTVILDVFATWCGPCWTYHQSHTLADIYDAYGPEGANDMFVMAIEADGSTNEDCLFGPTNCNATTIGDWTEGVPYPVSNHNQINGLYDINYFPTVYIVFPNRMVREMGQLDYDEIVAYRDKIPQLKEGINPEVIRFKGKNGATCNNFFASAPYFLLSNMGDETINTCKIEVFKNGESVYDLAFDGEVSPYGIIAEVQVQPNLVDVNTVFELQVSNINGDPSASYSSEAVVTIETNNIIQVVAQTDGNSAADNNRYEIVNEDFDIVASGDLGINNTIIENTHYLYDGGCYDIRVYDEGGDGVDGEIRITDGDGNLIYLNQGEFDIELEEFNVKTVSAVDNILSEKSFAINQNPVSDLLSIELSSELEGSISVCVMNVYGQIITHQIVKNQRFISIDAKAWTQGIYFVNLENDQSKITKQVVKQ